MVKPSDAAPSRHPLRLAYRASFESGKADAEVAAALHAAVWKPGDSWP